MRESKKETKKAPSTNAGQALPASILVAEDNKKSVIFKPFLLDDFQSTVQRVLNPRGGIS